MRRPGAGRQGVAASSEAAAPRSRVRTPPGPPGLLAGGRPQREATPPRPGARRGCRAFEMSVSSAGRRSTWIQVCPAAPACGRFSGQVLAEEGEYPTPGVLGGGLVVAVAARGGQHLHDPVRHLVHERMADGRVLLDVVLDAQ